MIKNKKKLYRVNDSEQFNLYSMYEHLKYIEIKMEEAPIGTYTSEQWSDFYNKLEEVQNLLNKAWYVGALVDWPTLKRIREIKEDRQFIRYNIALSSGCSEREAGDAFNL